MGNAHRFYRRIRNLVLGMTRSTHRPQHISDKFWQECDNSFLAPVDYYERRRAAVVRCLESVGRHRRALDVGCGDGTFTEIIVHFSEALDAFDISPSLLQRARERPGLTGRHVRIKEGSLRAIPFDGSYDLVSCMGVLSCLIDDDDFHESARRLVELVAPGGFLLLVDTLGTVRPLLRTYKIGYVARYRAREEYLSTFLHGEMSLRQEVKIHDMSAETINSLFLLQRLSA